MKSNNILKMDKYGSRSEIHKKYTIEKEFVWVGVLVTILSCILDFANVFTRYDEINKPQSVIMLLAMTLATVIALDVPMYIAGSVIKSYMQGETNKNEMIIIVSGSVTAFLALAIFNLLLSLQCGQFMLEDPALSSGDLFTEVEPTKSVLIGSWILGLLPVFTSIASFVVGIYCSNPLLHTVNSLKKALLQIQCFIAKAKQAMAEAFYNDPKIVSIARELHELINITLTTDPADLKLQRELSLKWIELSNEVDDSYVNSTLFKHLCEEHYKSIELIYSEELVREQDTLQAISKKLNNPDDISLVSEQADFLAEEYSQKHSA